MKTRLNDSVVVDFVLPINVTLHAFSIKMGRFKCSEESISHAKAFWNNFVDVLYIHDFVSYQSPNLVENWVSAKKRRSKEILLQVLNYAVKKFCSTLGKKSLHFIYRGYWKYFYK